MREALVLPLLFLFYSGAANNYYFSSKNGDDSRTIEQARSSSTPWKSVSKLNQFFLQLQPGDTVFFKSGEYFYGTIRPTRNGAVGNHIVFSSYGAGAKPVISGFLQLTNWANKGDNLWEADCPSPNPVNQLVINNVTQHLGRYPNINAARGGYLRVESHSKLDTIINKQLEGQNWLGAEAVIRKNSWTLDRDPIILHSGKRVVTRPTSTYEPKDQYGLFIQNHFQTLDQDGEWYYSKATGKMYLYSTRDPHKMEVSASILEHLLVAHNFGFFSFRNLAFEGANTTLARLQNSTSISFVDCRFRFAASEALTSISTDYVTVTNCLIADINNIGVTLDRGSRNAVVKNNEIRNIAVLAGMGSSGDESYHAIISRGNNTTIEQNTIDSVGYIAIRFEGDSVVIKNNFINHFMMAKDDGAAIYTWKAVGNKTANSGRVIKDNIILNGHGEGEGTPYKNEVIAAGIYLDDNADNIEVTGNSVAHCSYAGLYLHNTQNITVTGNTFFDNGQQVSFKHDFNSPGRPLREIVFTDNVLFSKKEEQLVLKVQSIKDDIDSIGLIDNNFYSRPRETNVYIQTTIRRDSIDVYETTNTKGWQEMFDHDRSTKETSLNFYKPVDGKLAPENDENRRRTDSIAGTRTYNQVRFEYNASMIPRTFELSDACVDERGAARIGSIELLPFTSILLVTFPAEKINEVGQ